MGCSESAKEEALDLLAAGSRVDIVLSDYQLSGVLDGWELRSYPSVETTGEQVPFVPKPYRPESVVGLIASATDGSMSTTRQTL